VLGFFFWSADNIDRRALERQADMAARALERLRLQLGHDQAGIAIWDEAVANTAIAFDPEWVHTHFGTYMHVYYGHDRTLLVSGDGAALYAMAGGERETAADMA